MSTDFFDDDLVQESNRKGTRNEGGVNTDKELSGNDVSEEESLMRHRDELSSKMAGTVKEIEVLKNKQADLERNKNALEELSRKQEEYDSEKKSLIEKLGKGAILLEKEQVQAARMVELFSASRDKFRELLADLQNIDESKWSNENFRERLDEALSVVENSRLTYNKALSRIDASSWHKGHVDAVAPANDVAGVTPGIVKTRSFLDWLKAGVALCIPFALVLIALFVAWLWASGIWPLR